MKPLKYRKQVINLFHCTRWLWNKILTVLPCWLSADISDENYITINFIIQLSRLKSARGVLLIDFFQFRINWGKFFIVIEIRAKKVSSKFLKIIGKRMNEVGEIPLSSRQIDIYACVWFIRLITWWMTRHSFPTKYDRHEEISQCNCRVFDLIKRAN